MQTLKCISGTILLLCALPAFATLITFDDIPAMYPPGGEDDPDYDPAYGNLHPMPVTDHYEHLGVSFGTGDLDEIVAGNVDHGGAAVSRYDEALVSKPHAISDFYGPGLSFNFVGDELPGYVSFHVTGATGVGITAIAYDDTGAVITILRSDGWWGLPELSTPAIPWQLMEIEGENIKTISVGNYYSRREMTYLDNLYFSNARPVPEASSWYLLMTGLLGLAVMRTRARPGPSN